MNRRKTGKKALSLMLCTALMFSLAGCGDSASETAAAAETEEKVLTQVLDGQVKSSHSSEAGKEETVYVMADATGSVNKIIVSDWVKNGDGSDTIKDVSSLQDIENVKGYEEYSTNEDGSLTWNAAGSDIYYQGTTEKELPVDVKITYTLDGKEITPEELAGKSGKVTIRFDYENKEKEKVTVNGKEEEVYIPFAMLSGMVLPQDTFSNIEATNAKVISEGDNNIVVGVAFPGLRESLKLDELKSEIKDEQKKEEAEELEIPEYIEVAADVTDFSLNMTMTMAMSDVLSDISLTDSIDVSDINDSMKDLQSASEELVDGTSALKDGTGELKDGAAELKDGTNELKNGTGDLKSGTAALLDGTNELKNGAGTLKNGTAELNGKSGELNNGAAKLDNGTAALVEGSKKLAAGTQSLATGSAALDAGAAQIKQGLLTVDAAIGTMVAACEGAGTAENPGLVNGTQTLAQGIEGLDTLLNQYFATYETDINNKIVMLQNMKTNAQAAASQAEAELAEALVRQQEAETALNVACQPVTQTVQVEVTTEGKAAQIATVSGPIAASSTEPVVTTAEVPVESISADQIQAAVAAYRSAEEQVASSQVKAAAAKAEAEAVSQILAQLTQNYMGSGQFGSVQEASQAAYITYIKQASGNLKTGAQTVNNGVYALYQGLQKLNDKENGVPALAAGADSLKKGTETAVTGTKELYTGAAALNGGIGTLKNGTAELKAGTEKLTDGTGKLDKGAGDLKDGVDKLGDGAKELDDGAAKLDDGAKELNDGVEKLNDGVTELDDGASELKDGMLRFDEEGISKLTEVFGDNIQEVLDRVDALKEAGSGYNTFTGIQEGTTGSVRFIYKTDEIKTK